MKAKKGNIWAGCCIIGIAIGFILSQFWGYGAGIPIGAMLGVGGAFLFTNFMKE